MRHRHCPGTAAVAAASLLAASLSGAAAAGAETLPGLHVGRDGAGRVQILDSANRTVILRGANATGLEDDYYSGLPSPADPTPPWSNDPAEYAPGKCPTNLPSRGHPPLCEIEAGQPVQSSAASSQNDFAQMRALGFNVVRLTLSWSQLEPTPGAYDQTYLDRIEQVVGWAKEQGIYVLLDMHEDNYTRFVFDDSAPEIPPLLTHTHPSSNHSDGAPAWAVLTDGEPSLALFGIDFLNAKMEAAFTSFWLNRPVPVEAGASPGTGLQDHYIGAIRELAKRFREETAVVGYEIMNEPLPGYIAPPGAFDQGYLYPFYRRVIDAVTGVGDGVPCPASTPALAACGYPAPDVADADTAHLFFFEPSAARNLVDFSPQVTAPFSSYPNLVFAPHVYTHVFTVDTVVPGGSSLPYPPSYDEAFQTAELEAAAMNAALFIGEYGNGSGSDDDVLLKNATGAQDRHAVGSAVWPWKANCGGPDCGGLWSIYAGGDAVNQQNGPILPSREKYLARAYPRATAGTISSYGYDPDAKTFNLSASAAPGDSGKKTVVFIPAALGVAPVVTVTGSATLDGVTSEPGGGDLAFVSVFGGDYAVAVAVAP